MDGTRRRFLGRALAALAASGLLARRTNDAAAAEPPDVPASMKSPGAGFNDYGMPAKYESKVTRTLGRSQPGTTGSGAIRPSLPCL